MTEFDSSKQLLQVVLDAFIAHQEAYEKSKVLHRDISINNILISKDGEHGVLYDWDLAITRKEEVKPQREYERTGAWQFMSAYLLSDPDKIHNLQDDMESFFHVILYLALRFLPHNKENLISMIMNQVFDSCFVEDGITLGGRGKFLLQKYIGRDFKMVNNRPLDDWIDVASFCTKQWTDYWETTRMVPNPEVEKLRARILPSAKPRSEAAKPPAFFSSHTPFREMWTAVLERKKPEWPESEHKEDLMMKAVQEEKSRTEQTRKEFLAGMPIERLMVDD